MSCPVRVTATFQKQAYGVEVTFSLQEFQKLFLLSAFPCSATDNPTVRCLLTEMIHIR